MVVRDLRWEQRSIAIIHVRKGNGPELGDSGGSDETLSDSGRSIGQHNTIGQQSQLCFNGREMDRKVFAAPETYLLGKPLHFLISQVWAGLGLFPAGLVVL